MSEQQQLFKQSSSCETQFQRQISNCETAFQRKKKPKSEQFREQVKATLEAFRPKLSKSSFAVIRAKPRNWSNDRPRQGFEPPLPKCNQGKKMVDGVGRVKSLEMALLDRGAP